MANLTNALQELRAERSRAQLHLEKFGSSDFSDRIAKRFGKIQQHNSSETNNLSSFEAENGTGSEGEMGEGWKGMKPVVIAAKGSSSAANIMSASARRKIAAAQRARWAKVRAAQKAA